MNITMLSKCYFHLMAIIQVNLGEPILSGPTAPIFQNTTS